MSTIFTVRELTNSIKGSMEKNFPFVWVKGEVSNLARPSSGHMYFSLKDNDALLNCVWFKNAQRREETFDPLTGEVFEDGPRPSLSQTLKNGQEVLCAGAISVYAPRGAYQLTISLMQESGHGALFAAFEALKAKLLAKGYFDTAHKKALPHNPQRVAVITSPKGAAIYDFLRMAQGAGTGSRIHIYPVPVQGEGAAQCIADAMRKVEAEKAADVIVLIRGGGSLEDLWAFNEEVLAEAIYASSIPVLAGIGHEVDISIADMAADVRAATPTHAAKLLWPAREEYMQKVDDAEWTLMEAGKNFLQCHEQKLHLHDQALKWLSPLQAWQRKEDTLRQNTTRLRQGLEQVLAQEEQKLARQDQSLRLIERNIQQGQSFLDAAYMRLEHAGQKYFAQKERDFDLTEDVLPRLMQRLEEGHMYRLQNLNLQLHAANPMAPLTRGYALMHDAKGAVIRSVAHVCQGQNITMQVADGRIGATVNDIQQGK